MASSVLANRVRVATATTGTGTVTLGAKVSNKYATFAEGGITDGQTVTYCIEDGNDWEIGRGVYTSSGTTLTRATVLISSVGGTVGTSKLNLSGSAQVFITEAKEDIVERFTILNVQSFTADGTYTPTSGMKYCLVISTGAGGGGGGADSDGSSHVGAGGGGAGATCIEFFTAASIGASQAVTVGTGGPGGLNTGANGTAGEDTTFGALHTAGGGSGGTGVAGTGTDHSAAGVAGGTATGGLINIAGGMGHWGVSNSALLASGHGGASFWGGGARGVLQSGAGTTVGVAATCYGSGGSGAANANTAAGAAGGNGADGIVIVIEFA